MVRSKARSAARKGFRHHPSKRVAFTLFIAPLMTPAREDFPVVRRQTTSSSQRKLRDNLVTLRYGVDRKIGDVQSFGSNGLYINDADKTQDLAQVRFDIIP